MSNYAILNESKTEVVNILVADSPSVLPFPADRVILADQGAAIGDLYQDGQLQRPPLPEPTAQEQAQARQQDILFRLREIDMLSIRPLRAIQDGSFSETGDSDKLGDLEQEAVSLRDELAEVLAIINAE